MVYLINLTITFLTLFYVFNFLPWSFKGKDECSVSIKIITFPVKKIKIITLNNLTFLVDEGRFPYRMSLFF